MPAQRPTFALVPGLFHTAQHFEPLTAALARRGYASAPIELPNIGAGAPTAQPHDDAAAVRARVAALADAGARVVLVAHSYGGIPAQQAIRGLDEGARAAAGQAGGIARIVWISAFAVLAGETNVTAFKAVGGVPVGWVATDTERGVAYANARGRGVLFGDLDGDRAMQDRYVGALREMSAHAATTPAADAPWDVVGVPKTYVHCLRDRALVLPVQRGMLARVRDASWTVEEMDCGHAPFLSHVEQLADVLVRAAESC